MNRNLIIMGIVILIVMSSLAIVQLPGKENSNMASYAVKAGNSSPIYIDGNSDFATQASSNGWNGSGTPQDPYIIANYTIDASSAHGINIQNTNVSFVIQNCTIYNGGSSYMGIQLYNVSNGIVQNCVLYNNSYGVYLNKVNNVSVSQSQIYDNVNNGVVIDSTTNATISQSKIYNGTSYGLYIYQSTQINITNNKIYNSIRYGLDIYQSANINITNNYVFKNDDGVHLYSTQQVNVSLNDIFDNTNNGVYVSGNTGLNYIFGDKIYNNSNGTFGNGYLSYDEVFNNSKYGVLSPFVDKSNVHNNERGVNGGFFIGNNSIYDNLEEGIKYESYVDYNTVYQNYLFRNNINIDFYDSSRSNKITKNNIYGGASGGVLFYDESNSTLHDNNIVGNSEYGLYNEWGSSSYPVNATNNWWGAVDGPSGTGQGSGDKVEGSYVTYNPWLSAPVVTIPSQPENLTFVEGAGYVNITWHAPQYSGGAAVKGYNVYRDGKIIATVSATQHYYKDVTGELGVIHTYFVTAINPEGESPVSNIVKAKLLRIPSQPVNLHAAAGNMFVNLSWNPPSFNGGYLITGYKIYRNSTLIANVSSLWYNDSGLVNGISYSYYVTAVNSAGEGERSSTILATPMTIPSEPRNLTASPGYTYIKLTWIVPLSNGGSNITEYRVFRNSSFIGAVSGDNVWYNDTSVISNVTYSYYVTAVNSAGESNKSNVIYATLIKTPSAPRNLTAIAGNEYVNLTWKVPLHDGGYAISGYHVYRNGTLIGSTSTSKLWYNDSGLHNGINYTYYIRAVNSEGEGAISNTVYSIPYTLSDPPKNLKFEYGDEYVNLSWDIPAFDGGAPVIAYKIYRNNTLIGTTSAAVTWFNDTGLINGIHYLYNITAVNRAGESNRSNTVNATPMTVPEAPSNLSYVMGYSYINISWNAPRSNGGSPVIEYDIYRNGVFFLGQTSSKLWYNDTSVMDGNSYSYYVIAVNSVGKSTDSNEINVNLVLAPTAPRNLYATEGGLYVNLTWNVPTHNGGSQITGYRIYRNGVLIASVSGSKLWYNDTNVIAGSTYTYYVTAINSVGESNKSTEISVTVPAVPEFSDWGLLIIVAGVVFFVAGKRKMKK